MNYVLSSFSLWPFHAKGAFHGYADSQGDGKGLRARHVVKGNVDFYFLFNEIEKPLDVTVTFSADSLGSVRRWDPKTGVIESVERDAKNGREFALKLNPHETTVLGFER